MDFITNLYPTPPDVADILVQGLKPNGSYLDPSAGKGDLFEAVLRLRQATKYGFGNKAKLYAFEIQQELVAILKEKRISVIDNDFLQYPGRKKFDNIIMNPPFDNGVKHLLHAWEISQGYGTEIRCLLNSETLNNPYSQDRQRLAKIIEKFGEVKDLGQCFQNSERPTDVNVSLVSLASPLVDRFAFQFEFDPSTATAPDFDTLNADLAPYDVFESREARYNAAMSALETMLRAMAELDNHIDGLVGDKAASQKILRDIREGDDYQKTYEEFDRKLTSMAWVNLIERSKMKQFTTSQVSQRIAQLQDEQESTPFTANNMEKLFYTLALSKEHIMMQCVLTVFDKLTKHHSKNRMAIKGWKTNSGYKVGKKFILPNIVQESFGRITLTYYHSSDIDDLEKAMCFVAGKRYDAINTIRSILSDPKNPVLPGQWVDTEFFEIKSYKVGTMHFHFKDEALWEQFNLLAAKGKQWLPEDAKMGAYK